MTYTGLIFRYALPAILCLLTGLAGKANAQDSLAFYLELAGKNNPGLQASYHEYSAALEKIPQAGALPDPTAELGFFLKPMELMMGNQVGEISLMQMFPWFGTLKAAKDEASQMAVMKFEEARDVRNQLYLQVKVSWYNIFQKKKSVEILQENLELLRSIEKITLSSYINPGDSNPGGTMPAGNKSSAGAASGAGSAISGMGSAMSGTAMSGTAGDKQGGMASGRSASTASSSMNMGGGSSSMTAQGSGMVNVLQVQMEIAEMENNIAETEDLLAVETARFNSLLNRPQKIPVSVPENLEAIVLPATPDSLTDSLQNNPMLRMVLAEKEAGQAQQKMASKMGKPMIGLGINYMLIEKQSGNMSSMNGNDMIMPMASVSFPFFSKKYKALRREASYRIEASEKSYINTGNELKVALTEALQQFRNAERRLELNQKQAGLALTSVNLLTTAFSASETGFEEVLRMQAQLLDYRLKELDALIELNTATAQIEYITGGATPIYE